MVTAVRSMKVCFVFCENEESAERRKWELTARLDVNSEQAVLRGWKRLLGVVQLKAQLGAWCKACSDEDVACWQLAMHRLCDSGRWYDRGMADGITSQLVQK